MDRGQSVESELKGIVTSPDGEYSARYWKTETDEEHAQAHGLFYLPVEIMYRA